jgi:hypothetical protein
VALVSAVVAMAVIVALDATRLTVVLLALAAYLSARMAFRWVLARHDRPLWIAVAGELRSGKLDEDLLQTTLPQLVHPALKTSTAVALGHLRADRADWDGVRACLGRMGLLSRTVVRGCLQADPSDDAPRLTLPERVMVGRSRLAARGGSDLPAEVLFCAGAILHGKGCYRRAFALGRRAYRARPDPVTAYNCACALALINDTEDALEWLRRALDAGYPLGDLESDTDLDSLRALPAFEALAAPRPTP